MNRHYLFPICFLASALCPLPAVQAAELAASDRISYDNFGYAVSLSGSAALIGAYGDDGVAVSSGSAYGFRNLSGATGTVTQNVKLVASDGAFGDYLGQAVSLSGSTGLIGAPNAGGNYTGTAYVFRGLDTATGTINQSFKLNSSDLATGDHFGQSLSLSGSIGLVGAWGDDSAKGSAYVFRSLDTATGTVTQNVKLTASDAAMYDEFGNSVSLSGSLGLVGADGDDDKGSSSGSAYVFRDLDTATGSINQRTKLNASDGVAYDYFGSAVSLSGGTGLVGAYGDDDKGSRSGAVYVFRNLENAGAKVTQNAKLIASDGAEDDQLGYAVGLSANTAVVGARYDDDKGVDSGSAYLYTNLGTATGTMTEAVKVIATNGAAGDNFGSSVSIDGDNFLIGAYGKSSKTGAAYTGSVSSMTTLDASNTSRVISKLSFTSRTDWIIGQTTDNNSVTLSAGDRANVTASGKAVYIGKNAGSDYNQLTIDGVLIATDIYIGAEGNTGNSLVLEDTATFTLENIHLAAGNSLVIDGDYTNIASLLTYLGATNLDIWNGSLWQEVDGVNYTDLITSSYASGQTTIQAVPEPGTCVLAGLGLGALLLLRRRN